MSDREDKSNLIIGDYRKPSIFGRQNVDEKGNVVLGSQKTRQMNPDIAEKQNQATKKKTKLQKMYPSNHKDGDDSSGKEVEAKGVEEGEED